MPGPGERGYRREAADRAPGETADDRCVTRTEPGPALEGQPRRGRKILRTAASAILIAATVGFAIPRIASYRSVWAVVAAAAASMASYWVTIRAVLPQLKWRQAATVNLGSNAVANTLPAGGALALFASLWEQHRAAWDQFVYLSVLGGAVAERIEIPYEGTTLPGYCFRSGTAGEPRRTLNDDQVA